MSRFRPLLVPSVAALALGALAFAACGDDDSSSNTTPNLPSADANGSATAASIPTGAPEIDQSDLAFKPDKLTVTAGTTVYFKNSDSAVHTVDVNGKNQSGTMKKGTVFAWTFAAAGTYKLTCDFHPQMNATVTVQ